jgi:hypothetical protein
VPSDTTSAVDPALADLVADAKRLQLQLMPRPRTRSPRSVDLTSAEIRIPESTRSLLDGYGPYGA